MHIRTLLSLLLLSVASNLHAADAPLNLLIIQTDEHNFRTLGCYRDTLSPQQALMWGKAVVETPHIDSLAKDGAICTSFYATTPVCSPSRASLVSGRYPQNTPVVTNNIPLSDDIITFAELLRRKGYATGFAGKWHLDGTGKPQWAPKRKFGFADNRYMFNRGHWKQLEDTPDGPRVAAISGGNPSYSVNGATKKNFTTDFLCDKAVDFIRENQSKPFCYYVSLPDPHGPDTVRAPYDTQYGDQTYEPPRSQQKDFAGVPSWGAKQSGNYKMSQYYGMVKCIDDNVGKLIDTLRDTKQLERTIIVFTSDHGDLRGEHFRQNKGVPYEGSARVPFLIRCPSKIKPGTVVSQALTFVDFQPTILSLLECAPSGKEEGRDASVLLQGKSDHNWNDVAIMRGTGTGEGGWIAVMTERYKLVYGVGDDPWMFDLKEDPDELVNVFQKEQYRDTIRKLSQQLLDYGLRHADTRVQAPVIRADLMWAISGKGPYKTTRTGKRPPVGKKKKRKSAAGR